MVFIGRIPARLEAGDILMRRPCLGDLRFVQQGLRNAGWSGSLIRTWWRLRSVFAFVYVIEISGRPAGIFGVYNLAPRSSAEITLLIFDSSLRRRGHGQKIFSMAAEMLRRHACVKKLFVMAEPANAAALAFWAVLGFRHDHCRGRNKVLSLELNLHPE